jgi:hypothetical protein
MASGAPMDSSEPHGENVENATSTSPATSNANPTHEPTVRFSSKLQEIEPSHSLHIGDTLASEDSRPDDPLSPEAQEEIRRLSISLQKSNTQHHRLEQFSFEPVSLPASRVCIIRNFLLPWHKPGMFIFTARCVF